MTYTRQRTLPAVFARRAPAALRAGFVAVWLLALLSYCGSAAPQEPQAAADSGVEGWIRRRLVADPNDAAAWRLLGRLTFNRGDLLDALEALERSVELQPYSAAARCDLAALLLEMDRVEEARDQLLRAIELAPESSYADDARTRLEELENDGKIVLADYQIRTFDGAEASERQDKLAEQNRSPFPEGVYAWIQFGALYDSNVALAPTSRALTSNQRGGFQAFVAPQFEWSAIDRKSWRAGPTFGGNFTFNEGGFSRFDLQSYRPGAFFEGYRFRGDQLFVPRLAYEYTHDEFAGNTYADRHALYASLTGYWNERDSSLLYASAGYTDFLSNGLLPPVTSQDGWAYTAGGSHEWLLNRRLLERVRAGVELSRADTRGTDYTFNGVSLFGRAVVPVTDTVKLNLLGGWGYRDYTRYQFDPSRNENIWRSGVELRKQFNDHLNVRLVFNYNRFDSKEPFFTASRYVAGLVSELVY